MNNRSTRALVILAAAGIAICSILFADGGPQHKATPAEAALNKMVLTAFAKAIPPGPDGWEKTGGTEITDLKLVFAEPNEPFEMVYFVEWQDRKRDMEAQQKLADALTKMDPKSLNDKTLAELQKKLDLPDAKARIELRANGSSFYWNSEKMNQIASVAGGLAFRSQKQEGSTYIFLGGNWKMDPGGILFRPEKKAGSSTVVQNIIVIVHADQKRADRLIQAIDWQALKALIKN